MNKSNLRICITSFGVPLSGGKNQYHRRERVLQMPHRQTHPLTPAAADKT
jgi:hypothetical protein